MFGAFKSLNRIIPSRVLSKKFGSGHHHGPGPHPPAQIHDIMGKSLIVITFLWVFYRFKVDGPAKFVILF